MTEEQKYEIEESIKERLWNSPVKVRKRVEKKIDHTRPYPYTEWAKKNMRRARVIKKYMQGITKARVDKQCLIVSTREYREGTEGIYVKSIAYTDKYQVQVMHPEEETHQCLYFIGWPSEEAIILQSLYQEMREKANRGI